jgi:hypothetical protein
VSAIIPFVEGPYRPVSDLKLLLERLSPEPRPGRFVFVPVEAGQPADEICHAWVRESEGPSAVVREEDALSFGFDDCPVFAWITLAVESDLESVGLSAAVSGALAEAGIPSNLLAGLRHDHVLVPFDSLDRSLRILSELSGVLGLEP